MIGVVVNVLAVAVLFLRAVPDQHGRITKVMTAASRAVVGRRHFRRGFKLRAFQARSKTAPVSNAPKNRCPSAGCQRIPPR